MKIIHLLIQAVIDDLQFRRMGRDVQHQLLQALLQVFGNGGHSLLELFLVGLRVASGASLLLRGGDLAILLTFPFVSILPLCQNFILPLF